MKLSFHGAAKRVTGACYLLESGSTKLLIDCGLFQGSSECDELNFEPFRFDPKAIDAILVTHAHLDHVGRIPKLVRHGFSGKIFSTAPTEELAGHILEDALRLAQREHDALYDKGDLEKTRALWETVVYGDRRAVGDCTFCFREAGHILGSAITELWAEGKKLVFSGDLGNAPSALLPQPDLISDAEYLVIESTYGSRLHESAEERVLKLERAVEDITARGGTLMIPAFATERTQDILFLLNKMLYFKRIPEIPVFVDAPLAIKITSVYGQFISFYKEEVKELYREHPHLFEFKKLRFTETVEESKRINEVPPPKVVISGSGMMSGGRILHHARRYLPDPKNILLIIGFQAAGSMGRRLIDGAQYVKLFGEDVFVRAEIRKINGFSAHADSTQLFSFVESNRDSLKKVFVVHGEKAQALHFSQEIKDRLGVPAESPELHEEFTI